MSYETALAYAADCEEIERKEYNAWLDSFELCDDETLEPHIHAYCEELECPLFRKSQRNGEKQ